MTAIEKIAAGWGSVLAPLNPIPTMKKWAVWVGLGLFVIIIFSISRR